MTFRNPAILTCSVFYSLSSILPLFQTDQWWIRIWDFPRLQLLVFGIGSVFLLTFLSSLKPSVKISCLLAVILGIGFDLYRIVPYSPLHPIEVQPVKTPQRDGSLRVLVANVLQDNEHSSRLLRMIETSRVDVILLLEVNGRWFESLKGLSREFPYSVAHPLENGYGIALFSRLPMIDPTIRFFVENDVPSVVTQVVLSFGSTVTLFGLHPRPPGLESASTTGRDAELVLVGKLAATHQGPVVVMGDLNDVAWSHTSRLFRRVSGLLDPRVGRGPYPTFPTYFQLFAFPLDYVFHSDGFRLVDLQRQDNFGSDHFPLIVELQLERGAEEQQEAPRPDQDDLEEAEKTIRRGQP